MKLLIINGPNLNIIGKRQPEFYGYRNFEDYLTYLREKYGKLHIGYYQSHNEGDIIGAIHKADGDYNGIILNGGSYSHTSIGIADAIQSVSVEVVEVHISNVYKREAFRHHSYLSAYCRGVITGFGLQSYELAIESFVGNAS